MHALPANRIVFTRREALVSLVAGAATFDAASQTTRDALAQPAYHEGDSWKFDALDYTSGVKHGEVARTVSRVTEDRLLVDIRLPSGKEHTSVPFTLAFNQISEGDHKDMALVRFPLSVGDTWDSAFRRTSLSYDLTRRAVAKEMVLTGAGELACVKIESSGLWSGGRGAGGGDNGNFDETYWYSPQARHIVKYMSRRWAKRGVGRAVLAEESYLLAQYPVR